MSSSGAAASLPGSAQNPNPDPSLNLGAWLVGPRDIRIQHYPMPKELGPHDVRVQMKAVGICGSDVHYYEHMRCASFHVTSPMVLGHESAGIVLEVGANVSRCVPGDRVALEPGRGCGHCAKCMGGRYNLCPEMCFFATPPVNGSLANQVVHPQQLCFVLPASVSEEEGALCEPLSVAVHACRRAGQLAGCHVAVMGAGPIGLLTLMVARAMGAMRVGVCDISTERLQLAKELGADSCVGPDVVEAPTSSASAGPSPLAGSADIVFDCVGRESTMRAALHLAAPGGKVVLVGMAEDLMTLPMTSAAAKEVDILGVFRYCNDYQYSIDLLASKKVNVLPLITHRFPFTDKGVIEAYETSASGGKAVKVMIAL